MYFCIYSSWENAYNNLLQLQIQPQVFRNVTTTSTRKRTEILFFVFVYVIQAQLNFKSTSKNSSSLQALVSSLANVVVLSKVSQWFSVHGLLKASFCSVFSIAGLLKCFEYSVTWTPCRTRTQMVDFKCCQCYLFVAFVRSDKNDSTISWYGVDNYLMDYYFSYCPVLLVAFQRLQELQGKLLS